MIKLYYYSKILLRERVYVKCLDSIQHQARVQADDVTGGGSMRGGQAGGRSLSLMTPRPPPFKPRPHGLSGPKLKQEKTQLKQEKKTQARKKNSSERKKKLKQEKKNSSERKKSFETEKKV